MRSKVLFLHTISLERFILGGEHWYETSEIADSWEVG